MSVINILDYTPTNHLLLKPKINPVKPKYRSRFLVNKGNCFIILPIHDVAHFYVLEEVIYAVGFNNKEYHLDTQMKILEDELDPTLFFRVNRQFIINITCIDSFEPYFNGKLMVKTSPKSHQKITVSKIKAKQFKNWIDR